MGQNGATKYHRRIRSTDRGATFTTMSAFVDAVRRQCRGEFLEARSPELLEEFLRRLEVLRDFEAEVRSHQAMAALLKALDQAEDLARRVRPRGDLAPGVMVCTRALASVADEVTDLRLLLSARLNLAADEALHEALGVRPEEELGPFHDLHHDWTEALEEVSWRRLPGHRARVFLALRQCGALGPRREFRTLAAASLLAGGETITFRPSQTTVADAIEFETKRMREVALRLGRLWATPDVAQYEGSEEPGQDGDGCEASRWPDAPPIDDVA